MWHRQENITSNQCHGWCRDKKHLCHHICTHRHGRDHHCESDLCSFFPQPQLFQLPYHKSSSSPGKNIIRGVSDMLLQTPDLKKKKQNNLELQECQSSLCLLPLPLFSSEHVWFKQLSKRLNPGNKLTYLPCPAVHSNTVSQSQEKRPRTLRQMFLCHHRVIISSCLY